MKKRVSITVKGVRRRGRVTQYSLDVYGYREAVGDKGVRGVVEAVNWWERFWEGVRLRKGGG